MVGSVKTFDPAKAFVFFLLSLALCVQLVS